MATLTYADYESAGIQDPGVIAGIIQQNYAGEAPLYAALTARGVQETSSPEFSWYTKGQPPARTQVNNGGAAYTALTTSVVVDSAAVFSPNTLALCEATGEIMLVTAVNSATNTLTVVRGHGGVAAAAGSVANDAYLQQIGYAAGEGASAPRSAQYQGLVKVDNFVQQFQSTVDLSGRAGATRTTPAYGRGEQRQHQLVEVISEIERALLHGDKGSSSDASGKRVTTTRGVLSSIVSHRTNLAGNLTKSAMLGFLEIASQYGSTDKLLLCGGTMTRYLTELFEKNLTVGTLADGINLQVRTLIGPSGVTFRIATSRYMIGATWPSAAIAIDLNQVSLRGLPGRGPMRLRADVQAPGSDSVVDVWDAEIGLATGDELTHAVLYGVTGLAA